MSHDEALVRAFVRPQMRARYLEKLTKDRSWVTGRLNHFLDLDERFASLIPKNKQLTEAIYELLKAKGAPETCYILGGRDVDGFELPLTEAIDAVFGQGTGVMISCLEGRLGYFEDEEVFSRYILERSASEAVR